MLRTPALFRYKDETGKTIELNELFEYVTNEIWLIGDVRNTQVGFRTEVMLSEDKAPEGLTRLYSSNAMNKYALGGKTTLEWIMTMSKDFHDKRGNKDAIADDMDLGAMIQESLLMFYNISDYQFLKEQFGQL